MSSPPASTRVPRLWTLLLSLLMVLTWAASGIVVSAQSDSTVRMVYFYAHDCGHCETVREEVLKPLQAEYGERMEIKMLEISEARNYELLIQAEETFQIPQEERGIPTLVINERALVGETEIRDELPCLLDACLEAGGTSWPDIDGLEEGVEGAEFALGSEFGPAEETEPCGTEEETACEGPAPVWMAYFYQVGCQACSRAEYDIEYAKNRYPQLVVKEFDIQENAALAEWMSRRVGVPEGQRLATPALFVGEDYLVGSDVDSEAVLNLAKEYAPSGAERFWADFDPQEARQSIVQRFRSFGALTVIFAGLVDGLNPCAFATLAFFVSYLTLSGRKGGEVLAVGAAFTLGVFAAYLVVGLGFYQVLGMLGDVLTRIGRWVYGLTAVLCAGLAIFSFVDFLKARRGEIGDMSLNLPHSLRKRINAVIRKGRGAQAYVLGSLVTGVVVSFLELACTGQVYLPTIIFVTSVPDLRVQAVLYLVLYNVLFVLPLVVVFILAYFGTTSKDLSRFLQQNAATVKLGMVVLFSALAMWLGLSLV